MPKKLLNDVENLKDSLLDDLNTVQEKCSDFIDGTEDTVKQYACDAKKFILKNLKKHPLKTVGVAALIGFGISQIFKKK